ncbi:MAG: HAMP domain-containing sensor histidine kinase [Anaerolineae bacterium]|nr:HAMP domain-containing histidine kinase [Thermoflexales bacterium]MDW8408134.1 HAMP domain-containing sensor histidine kinase [Anaerolineae bacterium]
MNRTWSLRWRLTLTVALVVAVGLAAAALGAYTLAIHTLYDLARNSLADEARALAASPDFLEQVSRRFSAKLARVEHFAQTCYRIVGHVRGLDDLEEQTAGWSFPLSDEGLLALKSGRPWSEVVMAQSGPVIVYNHPVPLSPRVIGVAQVAQSIGDQARALHTLSQGLAVGAGVLMLGVVIAAWGASGLVLRPIARMAESVRAMRQAGRITWHLDPPSAGPRELAVLGASLNELLSDLESALDDLDRRLARHHQLIAEASHELRTPLATVRGNLALLRRSDALDADEQRAILRDAVEECERMAHLLDELVAVSDARAGRPLRRVPVDVGALIEDVGRKARVLAVDRVLTVRTADRSVHAPIALCDPDALRQVVFILVDNAVKYTLSGGHITLAAEHTGAQVRISVHDDGVGIEPAHLPRIFDRFYRADPSRPGQGLGLSIARDLIERQGGKLTVESKRGMGSVFIVVLPAALPPAAASPA